MRTHPTINLTLNSAFLFPCDYVTVMHFQVCIRILTYITVFRNDRVFFFERGQCPPTLLKNRQDRIGHVKFCFGMPFEMDIYYITLLKKKSQNHSGFLINTLEVLGYGRTYFELLLSVMTEERKYFFEWR